jgi:hypothetical protein
MRFMRLARLFHDQTPSSRRQGASDLAHADRNDDLW